MVLAIGKYVDIPHQSQVMVVGVGLLKGLIEHLGDLGVGIIHPREDLFIHFCHPLRGFPEAFPVRVVAQGLENASDMGFNGFGIDHGYTPCRFGSQMTLWSWICSVTPVIWCCFINSTMSAGWMAPNTGLRYTQV